MTTNLQGPAESTEPTTLEDFFNKIRTGCIILGLVGMLVAMILVFALTRAPVPKPIKEYVITAGDKEWTVDDYSIITGGAIKFKKGWSTHPDSDRQKITVIIYDGQHVVEIREKKQGEK